MRFFFGLLFCCRPQWRPPPPAATAAAAAAAVSPPAEQEAQSLNRVEDGLRPRQQKRVSLVHGGGGSVGGGRSAEWRPALCAITEDCVVPDNKVVVRAHVKKSEKKKTSTTTERKSGPTVRLNVRRNHSDDFRQYNRLPVIPAAFSPTPFLF